MRREWKDRLGTMAGTLVYFVVLVALLVGAQRCGLFPQPKPPEVRVYIDGEEVRVEEGDDDAGE